MKGNRQSIKSDLGRIDAMSDADIDYSDIAALDESFFTKARLDLPIRKHTVTIRMSCPG